MKHSSAFCLVTSLLFLGASSAVAGPLSMLGLKSKRRVKVKLDKRMAKKSKAEQRRALEEKARKKAYRAHVDERIRQVSATPSYRKAAAQPAVFRKRAEKKLHGRFKRYARSTKLKLLSGEAGLPTAEVEVELNNGELMRELSLVDRALLKAGMPKIMFVVSEEYTGADKKMQKIDPPSLRTRLEGALLARGFTLVAKEQVEKVRSDEAAIFKNLLAGKNDAAVKYARGYGADILVTATGRVTHTSQNAMGNGAHRGSGELLLRAYKTTTGEIVHSEQKIKSNSKPNYFNESNLRMGMIKEMGNAIVESFVHSLLTRWDEEATRGKRYTVSVHKLNYSKGRAFQRLLKRIKGVSNVTQKTFTGGRLEVELMYRGQTDLAEVIIQASKGNGFRRLDVDSMRGQNINFKL